MASDFFLWLKMTFFQEELNLVAEVVVRVVNVVV